MQVQYLVGLFCCRHHPTATEITLGNMIWDDAAEKRRDVDVTIVHSTTEAMAGISGIEVKAEGKPLDVSTVEGLCAKLLDMPTLSVRGIVSQSGFTDGAINKAAKRDICLYHLRPWNEKVRHLFPHHSLEGTPLDRIRGSASHVDWKENMSFQVNPEITDRKPWVDFLRSNPPLFTASGERHATFASYMELLKSVNIQSLKDAATLPEFSRPPPFKKSEPTPEELSKPREIFSMWHEVQVYLGSEYFVQFQGGLRQLTSVRFAGELAKCHQPISSEAWTMIELATGTPFAGAVLIPLRDMDGVYLSCIFSPHDRGLEFRPFALSDKHKNAIRQLRLI